MPKCQNCGKFFSSTSSHKYHVNHHVCDKHNPPSVKVQLKLNYNNTSNTSRDELKEIFCVAFGKEDMNYIQQKLGDTLETLITNDPLHSIPALFNKIHNNDQLPEYQNVYVGSERSNYAMVSDGQMFKHKPKKLVIDQIINDCQSIHQQ